MEKVETAEGVVAGIDDERALIATDVARLVALLSQRTCGGCTITLTGADLAAVRSAAPDAVLQCPECDRILVRTDESGL